MSRATLAILFFVIRLFTTPVVMAADPSAAPDSCLTIPEALRAYYENGPSPDKLLYNIDLWYDAVLKGDESRARQFERMIGALIERDLTTDERLVDAVTREAVGELYPNNPLNDTATAALFDQTCNLFQCKQATFAAWRKSESVSNRYRLLGDYIQLLRRELGLPKLRFAATVQGSMGQTSNEGIRQD